MRGVGARGGNSGDGLDQGHRGRQARLRARSGLQRRHVAQGIRLRQPGRAGFGIKALHINLTTPGILDHGDRARQAMRQRL